MLETKLISVGIYLISENYIKIHFYLILKNEPLPQTICWQGLAYYVSIMIRMYGLKVWATNLVKYSCQFTRYCIINFYKQICIFNTKIIFYRMCFSVICVGVKIYSSILLNVAIFLRSVISLSSRACNTLPECRFVYAGIEY